jgi:hypothetical protein
VSFNLGVSNHPMSRLGGLSSIGIYLYEDIYYRQWISEIALAFYEGRQDEFVWLDLVRQFRNPEKQQILPVNLTKEIIDEISLLYREDPIYQVVDENGKINAKDQKLWEDVMEDARYLSFMDKLDRWTRLLGTVLVKVSFVDPETGTLVKETEGGKVQLDMMHGGVYDVRSGASPYYITELLIGFGKGFKGFNSPAGAEARSGGRLTGADVLAQTIHLTNPGKLGPVNEIYWSLDSHKMKDTENKQYETKNPYGLVPAVPFFNSDPAHYYFLPIDEPLIYANHAVNMRMTDLNHIAKFQSFGIPVIKGVERPTSVRQGRPVDDFNVLRGGGAERSFGGLSGVSGLGAGGAFRSFDAGLGAHRDGNADANALGFSLGPDTAIAVGEKGDFKFAHPQADITGLLRTIESITDIVRINHGLKPKYNVNLPDSGFGQMIEKMGVIEDNIRRGKLFCEREQQLFEVIKRLWNTHNSKIGSKKFSEKSKLKITYRTPEFPTDPKTKMETILMEQNILHTGDKVAYRKLYPHLSDKDIDKLIKEVRKNRRDQAIDDAEIQVEQAKILQAAGIMDSSKTTQTGGDGKSTIKSDMTLGELANSASDLKVSKPKIDNKAKQSEDSGKQGSDPRKTDKTSKPKKK